MVDQQSMEIEPGEAQAAGLGDREAAGRGRGAADAVPQPLGHLLAPLRQGLHVMVNSIYNGNRMEEVWLDK